MRAPHALGAHVSTAGGVERAIDRGVELGCRALQIFVKSPSQWSAPALAPAQAAAFRAARAASPIGPILAHAAYLINLAAPEPEILARSRRALGEEVDRCAALGLVALVVHPGAHRGRGTEAGLARVAESLDLVLSERTASAVRVLLENTAGQGSVLGHRIAELARIRELAVTRDRLGLCLDTCHAFAAGYPVDRAQGLSDLLSEIDELFGLGLLGTLHLNDSQGALGSRRDRHANLGQGQIGLELFRRLLAEPRLRGVPMILETPIGEDQRGHARDLELLRSLAAGRRRAGR